MFGRSCEAYSQWKNDWKYFNNIPKDLDIVNLGSTGDKNNFDYNLWELRGFNLATSPQDMYYDNQMLHQFGYNLKKGAIVMICLSEFAMLVDKYDDDYRNFKYYGILDKRRILQYSDFKSWMVKHCPGLLDNRYIIAEIKESIKKILRRNNKSKSNRAEYLKKRSEKTMKNWIVEFGWDKELTITKKQHEALERSWDILLDDIEYCKANGFIPIIVIPPFNEYLMNVMPNTVLDECLWNYVEKLRLMSIKILSYWDDKELQSATYYDTSIALNKEGRKIFNTKVQLYLKDQGLIKMTDAKCE